MMKKAEFTTGQNAKENEKRFYYNICTELNTELKLREVKEKVGNSWGFGKAPDSMYLRCNGELVAGITAAGCRMEIYDCGFAVYQTEDAVIVLRMNDVGHCWYEGDPEMERDGQDIDLSDEKWAVSVMIKGEDCLEKWHKKQDADMLVSIFEFADVDEKNGEMMEFEIKADVDVESEVLNKIMAEMIVKHLS